jgi:membrane fusion protein, copper/silver efflux system
LTSEQIATIKERKKPDLYITLRAPINGVVLKKMAVLGQFVKEGTEMFTINDLSHVWVKMDAYETDLPWIKYGQRVKFTSPAFPGRTFEGKVLFIDPLLDTKTRSVKVRVAADNPDYALKPGMFVTAELESELDAKGKVIKKEWAGKYICPIHPKDEGSPEPGICPDSKMALQPTSSFGYSDDPNPQMPLAIPATAPLITGTRTIVYVEVPGEKPTYELREIVLGPRAGDKYVVFEGLKEGEKVVVHGNFKIDSAMQIVGKPSMMSSIWAPKSTEKPVQEESIKKVAVPADFLDSLNPVIKDYLTLKNALADEDTRTASEVGGELAEKLGKMDAGKLDASARESWNDLSGSIAKYGQGIKATSDIDLQRKAFDPLSEGFAKLIMSFRHAMPGPLYLYSCSQAAGGQGAYWLETTQEIRNPYFGTKPYKGQDLLKCGELAETIPPEKSGRMPAMNDPGSQSAPHPDHSH